MSLRVPQIPRDPVKRHKKCWDAEPFLDTKQEAEAWSRASPSLSPRSRSPPRRAQEEDCEDDEENRHRKASPNNFFRMTVTGRVVAAVNTATAALAGCFTARDGRPLSLRSAIWWFALLLVVATPFLSGFSVLLLCLMVVLPLQVLIHRHHQTVTAETQKLPPLARVKAVDVWCVTSCSPVYGQEEGNSRTAAVGTAVLVAIAYYSGHVVIWNLVDGSSRGIWVCHEQPLRSVRFLQQKEPPLQRPRRDGQTYSCRLVVAGDDGRLVLVEVCSDTRIVVRHSVAAHSDFCRSVDVHPTLPLVLSASDDCSVKVWQVVDGNDTEEDEDRLVLFQALEGHDDFVMQVRCHPDGTSFVSASLDHTIHRWDIEGSSSSGALIVSPTPAATFCGHTDGVNCVDFLIDDSGNTRLVSGSDDSSIRIWNYRDAGLVFSIINAHRDNINAIVAHPSLPLMVSACEDGTCHAWSVERGLVDGMKKRQSPDVSLRGVWNLDRGRAWALAWAGHDEIALGFDHGPVLLRLESDSSACRGKVHSRARSLAFVDFEDPHGSSRSDRVDRGQAESSVSVFESMIISDADGRTVIHVSPGTSECER